MNECACGKHVLAKLGETYLGVVEDTYHRTIEFGGCIPAGLRFQVERMKTVQCKCGIVTLVNQAESPVEHNGMLHAAEHCVSTNQVNHPLHYNVHPSGVECITIIEWMTFNAGSAVKYLWRAGHKVSRGSTSEKSRLEDLKKARWYVDREIAKIEKELGSS